MTSRCVLLISNADVSEFHDVLVQSGFSVQEASSSDEVAKVTEDNQFSLVFLHLGTPQLLENVKRLRRTFKNRRTPVIGFMHENAVERCDREACLSAGICDYLTLPLVPERYALVMRRWTTQYV